MVELPRSGQKRSWTPGRLPFSRRQLAGLAWAALTVAIFSGWFVVTRFSVTRELRI